MTLVVVLLLGLAAVLIVSAIETDPTTMKSVSVLGTIQQIWTDQVDFSQPAGPASAPAQGGGTIPTDPNNPAWTTSARPGTTGAAPLSYQQAATLAYIQQQQRGL
jgi:hypothetical protein